MTKYFAIQYGRGPAWVEGKSVYEQRLLAHGNYMAELLSAGKLVLAGPFMDDSGGMTILNVESKAEAEAILEKDPAINNGVFTGEIKPWHIAFT